MAKRFQAPKGTRDLLPPETAVWAAVEATARRVFALYGYREIRTPVFEDTELFARGVGETSDIVTKEMYTFEDRGGRSLTLRPENTASVCRAYVEHGMQQLPQPVRLYYLGPQFRAERPQRGRYRQFHQIGAELLGGRGADADAEVILMLMRFFAALGFSDLRILVNTVGDSASRKIYRDALTTYLLPLQGKLSEDSRRRLESNPLRILDSKDPADREVLEHAPALADSLTAASRGDFERVLSLLGSLGLSFGVEPRLVRGLDYYTNTVFEVVSEGLGAQNAICGGGAYEGLVEELGGPPTYGVGFAIGEDRLIEVLPDTSPARRPAPGPVVVAWIGVRSAASASMASSRSPAASASSRSPGGAGASVEEIAEDLRRAGIPAVVGSGKQDKLFAFAEKLGSPFIVFVGEDELREATLSIRNLATREQQTLPRGEAITQLQQSFP